MFSITYETACFSVQHYLNNFNYFTIPFFLDIAKVKMAVLDINVVINNNINKKSLEHPCWQKRSAEVNALAVACFCHKQTPISSGRIKSHVALV